MTAIIFLHKNVNYLTCVCRSIVSGKVCKEGKLTC